MIWVGILGLIGPFSVAILLLILGFLSQRLGTVTHAKPYYRGFYVATGFVLASVGIRFLRLTAATTDPDSANWDTLYNGSFAIGVTLGVIVAWHYWSWLLAERD